MLIGTLEISRLFFFLTLFVLRQSADEMRCLMGDGCCHLVVSPLGWRETEQELSPENVKQQKQNVRAGNCEQAAECSGIVVHVLYECGGCECQRGKVFFPPCYK